MYLSIKDNLFKTNKRKTLDGTTLPLWRWKHHIEKQIKTQNKHWKQCQQWMKNWTCLWMKTTEPSSRQVPPWRSTWSIRNIWIKIELGSKFFRFRIWTRVVKADFLKAVRDAVAQRLIKAVKRLLYVVNKTNDCFKMHLTSVRLRASNFQYWKTSAPWI